MSEYTQNTLQAQHTKNTMYCEGNTYDAVVEHPIHVDVRIRTEKN